jgi:thioredoxin 2
MPALPTDFAARWPFAARGQPAGTGRVQLVECVHCGQQTQVAAASLLIPVCADCRSPLPWIVDAGDDDFAMVTEQAPLPVLADMWAPWCALCERANPALDGLARRAAGQLKLVKVNVAEAAGLRQRFRIEAVPTLIVLRGADVLAYRAGAPPEPSLRSWLARALAR